MEFVFKFRDKNKVFKLLFLCIFFLQEFQSLSAFSHQKDRYYECEVSFDHKRDKSCHFIQTICSINDVIDVDKDTRLVFTNAQEHNFTSVIFENAKLNVKNEIVEQFPFMETLEISGSVKAIDDFAFERAKELRNLDLKLNYIEEIKYSSFKGADNLNTLDLSDNEIREIHYETFEAIRNLETLKLSGNKIKTLDQRTFAGLTKLKYLALHYNEIVSVHPSIIRENRELYHFTMGNNPLKELHLQVSSPRFNTIDVEECELQKFSLRHPDSVNGTTIFRHLELDNNKFEKITDIHLDTDIYVQRLSLNRNLIRKIDDPVPDYIKNVTELELYANQIKFISPTFLAKLDNIRDLNLGSNKIEGSPKMFNTLKKLRSLNIMNNKISANVIEIFDGMPKLEKLNLEHNNLDDLDYKKLITVMPALKSINIDSNEFTCDFVQEMIEYLKNNTDLRVKELSNDDLYISNRFRTFRGITCDTFKPKEDYFIFSLIIVLLVAIVTPIILLIEKIRYWWSHINYRTIRENNPSTDEVHRVIDAYREVVLE